ncbi:MAG TPA: hypothetical protein VF452_08275 [Candidatus Binatia bacterium]
MIDRLQKLLDLKVCSLALLNHVFCHCCEKLMPGGSTASSFNGTAIALNTSGMKNLDFRLNSKNASTRSGRAVKAKAVRAEALEV